MTNFYLKIQRIEQVCLFELSWGKGQNLSVTLTYPEQLHALYQEWQRTYLNYYKKALRGRVADVGTIAPSPVDWHFVLVQAEAKFLFHFHKWLRRGELYEIRAAIASNHTSFVENKKQKTIDIFLTCNSQDLARLPWEAWEIGTDFAVKSGKIRIVRTPINIHKPVKNTHRLLKGKIRILAILGDETGLDFAAEKKAIDGLKRIADVEFIGWQPEQSISELKTQIVNAIKAESGWDILFFAGHSNETSLTGGEIAIAPNVTISINEIAPSLTIALEKGLQFALFNSCKGLSIANTLIDLGLSQVAVMREPIHNSVASEFLLIFLQALAEYKDVHEALLSACEYLKVETNLTYPSAYLIPSLFRHPEACLFKLEPFGIKQRIKKLIPNRREGIALSSLLLISLQLPVQSFFLQQRLLTQAIYRNFTGQTQQKIPPVLLVQIDEESITKAGISDAKYIDRKYLASIIDKLKANNAKIIGVDYILDRHHGKNDEILAKSVKNAVASASNPTWLVFAKTRADSGEWRTVLPNIASPNWSLQGEIEVLFSDNLQKLPCYMQLLPISNPNSEPLPFAYLLALSYQLNNHYTQIPKTECRDATCRVSTVIKDKSKIIPPQLNSQQDFSQQLSVETLRVTSLLENYEQKTILKSSRSRTQPLTILSYYLNQMWLHPIIDFSIPANQVYQRIPAWQLLENENNSTLSHLQQQVVIIAAGGYGEAGMAKDGEDNFNLPSAVEYWRLQQNPPNFSRVLPGGEVHAYMVHHFINQRLVVPIPDFWMILPAIFLGKYLYSLCRRNSRSRSSVLIILSLGTALYGLVSLQIYLSPIAVILPWFLPSMTVWMYVLPTFLNKNHEKV